MPSFLVEPEKGLRSRGILMLPRRKETKYVSGKAKFGLSWLGSGWLLLLLLVVVVCFVL